MTEAQEAQLIAACDAVNDDAEINQLMADWECTTGDGIEELQREEAACGRTIASVFGPPPRF
jgi:hypothetical protein